MCRGKLLIGSPVCQDPMILEVFLHSITRLELPDYEIFYHFIDDNHNSISQALLTDLQQTTENVTVERPAGSLGAPLYQNHNWHENTIWKVAAYKDALIERTAKEDFDYLFLIDSDLILYPQTVKHLIEAEKEVISEIFWTKWSEYAIEQPQVWISDFYTQYEKRPDETLSPEEERARMLAFFQMLRTPGIYEVGGLGACTLISKSAIKKGVSFQKIKNLSIWGEDRHFCIRACALGVELFADTHFPAYHVYRPAELERGREFLKQTEPEQGTF